MRVLHIYSGNLYGGIEAILTTIARHAAACPDLSSEFALCFEGRLAQQLTDAGARVHRLGEVRVRQPQSVRRARRALAELLVAPRFDRVICHGAWAHALFAPIARRRGVTLAFWAHDVMRGHHWTERWAKRTPPVMAIANSRFTAATVPAVFPNVPVSVVYAPVALPSPEDRAAGASLATRAAVRAELDTSRSAIVIVQASRMEAWKGHEVLLDALSLLRG